jgi:hypothetical protein
MCSHLRRSRVGLGPESALSVPSAVLVSRIHIGDHTVAAELSEMLRAETLSNEVAVACVPLAWRWNNQPLADLSHERWIDLFRYTGYTHDYQSADLPNGSVRLWRGSRMPERMSWTADRNVARGFAIRNAGLDCSATGISKPPVVWRAVVDPARLLAYLTSEQEYIIDPLGIAVEQTN